MFVYVYELGCGKVSLWALSLTTRSIIDFLKSYYIVVFCSGQLLYCFYDGAINFPRLDNNIPLASMNGVYFTTHALRSSLQLLFRLFTTWPFQTIRWKIFKESSQFIFNKFFSGDINTLLKSILSVYYIDDERWYWQLDFGSNMKYDD